MFLVDSAEAQNWDSVITTVQTMLERADAEIVSIKKWEERRLAYDINGKSRGTYILCYFRADGDRIHEIERDVHLSERIMRVLILSAETREKRDIEKDLKSQEDGETGPQAEVKQADANREGGRSGIPEAPAAGAGPVINSLQSNDMAEEGKISNGAIESEQSEPEGDIGQINESGGQEAKED
jgi:small subunit ribosomal protein S6